jgi:hypothetical protein
MPAGPVRRTFQGDAEFSCGIWAAVSSAASGVGAFDEVGDADVGDAVADGDAVEEGDAEVVGSSVTVSVASGLSVALAVPGSSSSRDTEQPAIAPPATSAVAVSTAMTERYRDVNMASA